VGQNRASQECRRSQPLHSQLTTRTGPNHPKLGCIASHLYVQHFANADPPNQALNHQTACAHICDQCWVRERPAISIHAPDLHWELNLNAGTLTAIHVVVPKPFCGRTRLRKTYAGYRTTGYRSARIRVVNEEFTASPNPALSMPPGHEDRRSFRKLPKALLKR
jgi:hypothetical protein